MNNEDEKERAYLSLVRDNKQIIYKVCYLYANDEDDFKDLYQEVLARLWTGYASFRGEALLSTWIYRVCLNTCITFCHKHRTPWSTLPIERLCQLPDEDADRGDCLREMYRLIHGLNRMEKALILMWLDERTYEEISEVCGLPRNTVATRLRRIKEKLTKMAGQ